MNRFRPATRSIIVFLLCNAAVFVRSGTVNIGVDPRIELISVVQLLSGAKSNNRTPPLQTQFDFPYKRDVLAAFSPYRNHEAVARYLDVLKAGFGFAPLAESVLVLSYPPELKSNTGPPLQRSDSPQVLAAFVESLRGFAGTSRFMVFYKKHLPYYRLLTEREKKKLDFQKWVSHLEDYCGGEEADYRFILSPLLQSADILIQTQEWNGSTCCQLVVAPNQLQGELPDFGSKNQYRHRILHEFGHFMIDPVVESHAADLERSAPLWVPIKRAMENQGYADWKTSVGEHVVRAVSVRLTYRMENEYAGRNALNSERILQFRYIEPISNRLKEYEDKRKRYKSIRNFFPEIVRTLEQLVESAGPNQ